MNAKRMRAELKRLFGGKSIVKTASGKVWISVCGNDSFPELPVVVADKIDANLADVYKIAKRARNAGLPVVMHSHFHREHTLA